ncbi:VOC family protein [Sulfitobacter albidus]|uniref:VOC family protein n=1 Tax=Sulfitobacter albidus TaxID=2829501 RepID=A0A975JG64_9RHOB|nr:VOC family protein [Sulfitobacter albidus]QUJ77941.1 VOC family protein [Sulfitobacter albidus]
MRLDHIAIAAQTLEEGVAWAEARLGVAMGPGGRHARYGTHNRLLGLAEGLYLEVIAPEPGAPSDGPRWFGLDEFTGPPRLANWICAADPFTPWLRHGMRAVPMQRGDLRWDMGVPEDGRLPMGGAFPTVLHWHSDSPPGQALLASGCALSRLTVQHPDAEGIAAELAGALTDPRIGFVTGPAMLTAQISTPNGLVTL